MTDKLSKANKELALQHEQITQLSDELAIANKELAFQNEEKTKRADELVIADKELAFQNEEKTKRADELVIADKELVFQKNEKAKRASELVELVLKNQEIARQAEELRINAIKAINYEKKLKASFMETIGIARLLVECKRSLHSRAPRACW